MEQNQILYSGEAQLMAWGESMQAGAWIKLWLHPEDLEAFKLMKARVGKTPGQRLGVCIVAIGDDEAIVQHAPAPAPTPRPTPAPTEPPVKGPTIRLGDFGMCAVRWCGRPDFWRWAAETSCLPVNDAEDAKWFVLDECGVTTRYGHAASRKHLDAVEFSPLFLDNIFRPYSAWAQRHGIDLTQKPPKANSAIEE